MSAKTYELLLLLKPDKTEKQLNEVITEVKKHITDAKGSVANEEVWGLRDLAYKITKYDRGFYVLIDFLLETDQIQELEDFLRLDQIILRHLLTIPPHQYDPIPYDALREEEEKKMKAKKPVERFDPNKSKQQQHVMHKPKANEEGVEAKPVPEKEAPANAAVIAEALDAKLSKIIDQDVEI